MNQGEDAASAARESPQFRDAVARGLSPEVIVPEDSQDDRRVGEDVAGASHPHAAVARDALAAPLPPRAAPVTAFVLILLALGAVLAWWAIGG